jgi:hypothetical protein
VPTDSSTSRCTVTIEEICSPLARHRDQCQVDDTRWARALHRRVRRGRGSLGDPAGAENELARPPGGGLRLAPRRQRRLLPRRVRRLPRPRPWRPTWACGRTNCSYTCRRRRATPGGELRQGVPRAAEQRLARGPCKQVT